jgi:DNA-binding MarR family transcriptional regulator
MDKDRRKIAISMTEAAQEKIDEIEAIWRDLEIEALDQVEPQQLRVQLSAIARNLSKSEDKASHSV